MTKKKPFKPIPNPPPSSSSSVSPGSGRGGGNGVGNCSAKNDLDSSTTRSLAELKRRNTPQPTLLKLENDLPDPSDHRPTELREPPENPKLANVMRVVKSYWNSISADEKLAFLDVSVESLKDHFLSSEDQLALDFLQEAIQFAEANLTWNCWVCFDCKRKFGDRESHSRHTIDEHFCSSLSELRSTLLQEVPSSPFSRDWKPINIQSAVKILQNCIWVSQESPLPDEAERTQLLGMILGKFKSLALNNCLSWSLLKDLLIYLKDQVRNLESGSTLLGYGSDCLLLYICVLGAPQLREISHLLDVILSSCWSGGVEEIQLKRKANPSAAAFAIRVGHKCKDPNVLERLGFQLSQSKLQLDWGSLNGKFVPYAFPLFYWISSRPKMSDQLSAWNNVQKWRSDECMKILARMKMEFELLVSMAKAKLNLLRKAKILCENHSEETGQSCLLFHQSHAVILKDRQVELAEWETVVTMLRSSKSIDSGPHSSSKTLEDNVASSSRYLIWHDLDCGSETAISTQEDCIIVKLNKIDAKMRQNLHGLWQLLHELGPTSSFDYHRVLMPLVKSFLSAQLSELTCKYAKKLVGQTSCMVAENEKEAEKKSNGKGKKKGS